VRDRLRPAGRRDGQAESIVGHRSAQQRAGHAESGGAGQGVWRSTATVALSWSGLAADKRYLGAATYLDPNGQITTTTAVAVDTDNAVPVVSGMERTRPSRRSEL